MKKDENQQEHDDNQDENRCCCEPRDWGSCCPDSNKVSFSSGRGTGMSGSMTRCFSSCRNFIWVPVVMGILFLLLGYFLSSETIRVLWMTGAGIVAVMALFGLLAMWRFSSRIQGFGCCQLNSKQKINKEVS